MPDNLTQWVQSTPFNQRKQQYANLGLTDEFRGTPEQNKVLFSKMAPASALSPEELLVRSGTPARLPPISADETAKIISGTTPSTMPSDIFDLTQQTAAQMARGKETIERGVTGLTREAETSIAKLGTTGAQTQREIAEKAAGFGGAWAGMTQKFQAEIAQEVTTKQETVRARLGDDIYNLFTQEEQTYGTDFLASLSIPQAQQFAQLPSPIRGSIMTNYQEAIEKAQKSAADDAQAALGKMGYTIVGGQVMPTLEREKYEYEQPRKEAADIRAEEAAARSEKQLAISEERLALAEEAAREPKRFSQTQLNKGAAEAGMTAEQFNVLDPDVQNLYVSGVIADKKAEIDKMLTPGINYQDPQTIRDQLMRSNLPQEVILTLRRYLRQKSGGL